VLNEFIDGDRRDSTAATDQQALNLPSPDKLKELGSPNAELGTALFDG
jgi:hypothetical protein